MSLWDSVYVAVAVEHRCPFLTADRRLFRANDTLRFAPNVYGRVGPSPAPVRSMAAAISAMSSSVSVMPAASIQPST